MHWYDRNLLDNLILPFLFHSFRCGGVLRISVSCSNFSMHIPILLSVYTHNPNYTHTHTHTHRNISYSHIIFFLSFLFHWLFIFTLIFPICFIFFSFLEIDYDPDLVYFLFSLFQFLIKLPEANISINYYCFLTHIL
jgi:hypothetical protein